MGDVFDPLSEELMRIRGRGDLSEAARRLLLHLADLPERTRRALQWARCPDCGDLRLRLNRGKVECTTPGCVFVPRPATDADRGVPKVTVTERTSKKRNRRGKIQS